MKEEEIKNEYLNEISKMLQLCIDISLLDLILKLLRKSC